MAPVLERKILILGSSLALFSACSFALNMVLAGISYGYGANVHAQNLSRAVLFLCSLWLFNLVAGNSFRLPRKAGWSAALIGVFLCTEMYVLLAAIQTIHVALAVLIFYTYPMLIAVFRWLTGRESFSLVSLVLLLTGFFGLAFVLIHAPVHPATAGVLFSVAAAIVMATMLTISEATLKNHDSQVVLFYALASVVSIIFLLLTVVEPTWPTSIRGWSVFGASAAFYVMATFTLFKAVSLIGPLKTAIIDNTAPVWAIILGYLLLEQVLSGFQIAGAVIVITAVILLQWTGRSRRPKNA